MTELSYSQAIRKALTEEMQRDDKVFILGEDVGIFGGAFGVTQGMIKEFGKDRVRDTPISEAAIMGAAIGAALTGMRPVVEIMYIDFLTCCMDELVNQAAKIKYMTGGQVKLPLTVRVPIGAGYSEAAQHSQSLEALFVHIPGLKVVIPSTPYDAKGLLKSVIRDDDPVIFLEHKALYDTLKGEVPDEEYLIPLGKADIKKEGRDITVIATSMMVHKVMSVSQEIKKDGIDVEVIDPRSLVPLDKKAILNSVKKTGRVILVEEAVKRNACSANIASIIMEEVFEYLKAPIFRICSKNTPIPFSPILEKAYLPCEEEIYQAITKLCK